MTGEFSGKRIAIIGLAATGLATAIVLRNEGAFVSVYDSQPETKLPGERVREARSLGANVSLHLGNMDVDFNQTDLIVPSPGVPRNAPVLVEAVERGVPVLGEIEIAYRIAKAPILAITGTNGKTTTTALLGAILRAGGYRTWVAGNIAEDSGIRLPLIEAAAQAPAGAVIAAEISSFQLEWVTTFRPRVAAWLNLSADHLDRYDDMDDYARAKAQIFAFQGPDDWAVVNDDDAEVLRYSKGQGEAKRARFGLSRRVWLDAENAHEPACAYLDGQNLLVENLGVKGALPLLARSDIPIPGTHNVANVLAASTIALAFGVDLPNIRAAVRAFTGVTHRMEIVGTVNAVRYINNSMCTNPAAVAASLEGAGEKSGAIIAIAGGKHKGGDLSPMSLALQKYARRVVLIGEAAPVLADLLDAQNGPVHETARTLPDAVFLAASHALPGETVILVPGCASFDMFTGFEQRGQVFREAVAALAKGMP